MTLLQSNIGSYLFVILMAVFLVQSPDWAYVTTAIGQCGLLGWCIYKITQSKDGAFNLNWISGSAILVFVYLLASLFWSQVPGVSIFSLSLYVTLPVFILAYSFSEKDSIDIQLILKFLCFIGAGLGIYAIYQFSYGIGVFDGVANYPFVNPNSLAVMLGICGLCCLNFLIDDNSSKRWLFILALCLIMVGLVLTHSRAGVLMFSFATLFLIANQYRAQRISIKRGVFYSCMVIGSLLTFPYIIDFLNNEDLSVSGSFDLSSLTNARVVIWNSTIQAIFETNFWFGNGAGTFPHIYSGFRDMADNTYGNHAHNDILHLWLELGVVGLITLVPLVIGLLFVFLNLVRRVDMRGKKIVSLSIILFMGGMAMATPIVLLYIFLLIVAIMLVNLMGCLQSKKIQNKLFQNIIVVLMIFVIGISMVGTIQTYYSQKAEKVIEKGDLGAALKTINVIDIVSMGLNPSVPLMRAQILQGMIDNQLIDTGQIEDAIFEMRLYIQNGKTLNPYNEEIYYTEGQLFLYLNDKEQAQKAFEKSVSLDPKHIKSRLSLVNLTDDIDKKLRILREGIGYRYIKRDPKPLYLSAIMNAQNHSDENLLKSASDWMRSEMQLK